MANIKQTVKLGVFTLAIMNVTAVVSLRGLPAEAVYGMSSAFYYLFAAIVFLIPTSLVAAELAAMFQDKQGGVFRWVGEAYGKKLGFLAIWVQWIESTIWYPTVLTFGAVSIAFIGMNDVHDMSLANNKYYSLVVVLIIYWLATFISMKGMSWVGKVAKVGGLVGTIIPAALLIILGIIYLATGGHSNLDFHSSFFPDLTNFDNVVLAASIFLFYAGMEMGGIHVKDVNNPSKNYPKAVFIGAAITVIIFVLGTFSLGIIIPAKDISLTQSLLVGFELFPLHPRLLAVTHHRHCSGIRGAGRCIDMGCRSVQRYLCRRKSRLHASVLPEDKQTGCTEEYLVRAGYRCDCTEFVVRRYAFRTEFLSDSVTADSDSLSDYVFVNVLRSYRTAL